MLIKMLVPDFCQASNKPFSLQGISQKTRWITFPKLVANTIAFQVSVLLKGVLLDYVIELFILKFKFMAYSYFLFSRSKPKCVTLLKFDKYLLLTIIVGTDFVVHTWNL